MSEETIKKSRAEKTVAEPIKETMPESKSQQQLLYESLQDPATSDGLMLSARNLRERFRGNAFTIEQIVKKTNVKSPLDARQLMNMLVLKGVAVQKQIGRDVKYQISFTKKTQLEILNRQLKETEEQVSLIKEAIAKVEAIIEEVRS